MKINYSINFMLLSIACLWAFMSIGNLQAQQQVQPEMYSKIKISDASPKTVQTLSRLGLAVDCGLHHDHQHKELITEFSARELALLDVEGIAYEVLIADMQRFYQKRIAADLEENGDPLEQYRSSGQLIGFNSCEVPNFAVPEHFELGSMGQFITYDEMITQLDSMALLYPELISPRTPINDSLTIEGRPVYWLKISDQPLVQEEEPQILYTALHHAREPLSMMQLLFYMWYLLENYDKDPAIADLVNNTEMYFVPCINPDGYIYNQTTNPNGGGYWRKNRRDNGDGNFGVDLNRNYGYLWGLDDEGSSPDTYSDVYRGTAPFSEAETQMMRYFCNNHDFKIVLNYHSYSNLLLFPWGYDYSLYTPDNEAYRNFSRRITNFNRYKYGTGDQTVGYIVNGSSDDWMYGEQDEKEKSYAFTPEVGNYDDGFWPSPSRIIPLCIENVMPNLMSAYLVGSYAELTDRSPVKVTGITGSFDFGIQRLGLEDSTTFSISLTPLSDNIMSATGINDFENMAHLEMQTGSFNYTLDSTIAPGDEVSYVLNTYNGSYVLRDTIYKIYEAETLLTDDASVDGLSNWMGTWDVTDETAFVGTDCITDSPLDTYTDFVNSEIVLENAIDLSNAEEAYINFWAKWEIEPFFDYVQIMASIDGGSNWTPMCGKYTRPGSPPQTNGSPIWDGEQYEWIQEEICLEDYLGEQLLFKFNIRTDGGLTTDGFYFDDLSVVVRTEEPRVKLKLFLEGAYDTLTNEMRTNLSAENILPISQPFNQAPWNYIGTESVESSNEVPEGVVDWVLVEVRDVNDNFIILEQAAGFLLSNGQVVDVAGNTGIAFPSIAANQDYFVSVKHRNHVAVMSRTFINVPNQVAYDFTISSLQAIGVEQLVELGNNTSAYALRAGDIDSNGVITVADFNQYIEQASGINSYLDADCSLDGNIVIGDLNVYSRNLSKIGALQIRY